MTSEYAYPVPHSPNELGQCPVTGLAERGVTFPSADPAAAFDSITFIGETAIVEAFGVMFDLTPNKVRQLIKAAHETKELRARVKELEGELDKWHQWQAKAEDLGMTVTLF